MSLLRSTILSVLAAALLSPAAFAHPLSVSYAHVGIEDRTVRLTVRVPMDDMDLLLRLDQDIDGTVTDSELQAARPAIAEYMGKHLTLATNGPLPLPLEGVTRWADSENFPYVQTTFSADLPTRHSLWSLQVKVITDLYRDHRTVARIERPDFSEDFLFQHGNTYVARPAPASFLETASAFIAFGIEHIFLGYDHIVFLFGLLLAGQGFRQLVAVVSSFTLAHSITLSVAALGLLAPVPWTIEAAIALSVAYVGIENLFIKDTRHRWKLTFVFGLIHGFGFANVLREMHLPSDAMVTGLFTFNLGVEIGQIIIVGLMWPLLRVLERQTYRPLVVRVTSVAIAAVGLFWFFERVV